MTSLSLPRFIQHDTGAAVSRWRLAAAISRAGQLGVVSGSMLETIFVPRQQDSAEGGRLRRL